jgi:hypothetical protein
MTQVHCFTSASFAYLDRVRVLGDSLRRHHPDWTFWLCLSDKAPEGFEFHVDAEPIDHLVTIDELGIGNLSGWIFEHDVVELCTAVKGVMLTRLLDQGADKVIYLDPDIAVFEPLDDVVAQLDQSSIVLTPHQLEPDDEHFAIVDNEIGSLKFGIFNLGFIAVANTPEGNRFARWWRDRLLSFCFDDVPNGLFTDQKWCDHVPALFSEVHVLRHAGYNVASWNLSRRPISIEENGTILAGGVPLKFFHFTKVTHVGEVMLERYCNGQLAIFELLNWYRKQLQKHVAVGLPSGWWAFGKFDNGEPVRREHRLAYRRRADLRMRYPDPYGAADPTVFREG